MSQPPWPKYPPCASGSCTGGPCCARGHKWRWPELVGKNKNVAKAQIEKDNPYVTVIILDPGRAGTGDFCCNRVYIIADGNGNVMMPPYVS